MTPGVSWSTSIIDSPRWRDSGVPVRTSATHRCATLACDVQILCPLITQSSPSRTAFVRSDARSLPASGSEKPWHHASSPRSSASEMPCARSGVYTESIGMSVSSV